MDDQTTIIRDSQREDVSTRVVESSEKESGNEVMEGSKQESHAVKQVPDASMLEDRFPEWARMSRMAAVWTTLLGFLYAVLNYHRLWYTDLWGHLAYGRVITRLGSIPATEPLLPLSQGMPFYDTAWLWQLGSFFLMDQFGVTSLRFLYAACLTICFVALLVRFQRKTRSFGVCLLGLAIFGLVAWKSLSIIRPQIAGLACFVVVCSLVLSHRWTWRQWVFVPSLFLLWANLHGSFPVGLGMLGLLWMGKTADQFSRTRRLFAWPSLKYLLLLELALLAVLINPYGIGIFAIVRDISSNPNFTALLEWDPLTLRMVHGQMMMGVSVLLVILYRLTPRRISLAEPLLLFVFGLAGWWSVRFVVWWTPLAAWFAVLHAQAILKQHPKLRSSEAEPQRAGLNTVAAVGLLWIFFAYTPFGATLLHGYPQDPEKAQEFYRGNLSEETPVLLANYLNEYEPEGLIFNAYEWGDYLLWTGPEDRQLFLNSHAHLIPREVWLDYFTIARANRGWDDKLDRYGANTVVIDKKYHNRLIDYLKRDEGWRLDYEDDLGAIFFRKKPIITGPIIDPDKAD